MAEKKRIEIPPYIVRDQERKPFQEKLSSGLFACNKAYKALSAMQDLEDIPDKLQDINTESVENFINDRLAEISDTRMLTHEQKEDAKKSWERVRKDALSYIRAIKDFLSAYPDADVCVSKGEVVCSNFDELVTEHCKIKTPEEVSKHADLIQAAKDAVETLWAFEREHDCPNGTIFRLEEDFKMLEDPVRLAESWLYLEWRKEYLKSHPYLQGAYDTNLKRGLAEQNARLAEKRKKHFEEHPEDFVPLGNKTNPYVNQHGPAGDCLDYSVEIK